MCHITSSAGAIKSSIFRWDLLDIIILSYWVLTSSMKWNWSALHIDNFFLTPCHLKVQCSMLSVLLKWVIGCIYSFYLRDKLISGTFIIKKPVISILYTVIFYYMLAFYWDQVSYYGQELEGFEGVVLVIFSSSGFFHAIRYSDLECILWKDFHSAFSDKKLSCELHS